MADSVKLVGQTREGRGTQAARRLRKKGLTPAVLYGHKEETLALAISTEELESALRHGVHVLDLEAGGKTDKALIKDVQWDHLGKDVLHVDFTRVSEHERITLNVPIELRGIAPGVGGGGALDQPLHSILVECPALSVPESIRVNISELQIGSVIHVRDLVLPAGVKAMADADAIVVQITAPQTAAEPGVAAPAAEQAEPEVIGRKAAAEEEEGE